MTAQTTFGRGVMTAQTTFGRGVMTAAVARTLPSGGES